MTKLLFENDKSLMKNAKFVKNACFYKDMFAFYEAYELLLSQPKEKLPNYCFSTDGNYLLEGICLVMKNYASEFSFESLKLTLDYLKVLYYTIASFSKDGNLPDKELIQGEFNKYQQASNQIELDSKTNYLNEKKKFDEAQAVYDQISNKYAKKLISSNLSNIFAIVLLVFSFGVATIPCVIYSYGKLSIAGTLIMSGLAIVLGIVINICLKKFSKKFEAQANELLYSVQQKKKIKDGVFEDVRALKLKYSKIASEKYEYNFSFSSVLKNYSKNLDIDSILERASEYKLVSYNLKLDIQNLFKSQQNSVDEMIKKLETSFKGTDTLKLLKDCYLEIKSNDWMFYNNQIRFAFLNRFCENAEKTYTWKLDINSEKINPFDVDIKAIAKEQITYLKDDNSLFVAASLDKFLNTNYIKNSKAFELKNLNNLETIKSAKLEYLLHFYSYDKTKDYDNLFYDKKLIDGVTVSEDIRRSAQRIPTLVLMKLKLRECQLGYENCNFDIISQIIDDINSKQTTKVDVKPEKQVSSADDDNIDIVSDITTEDFGDYIRYNVGGNVFVGYKFV